MNDILYECPGQDKFSDAKYFKIDPLVAEISPLTKMENAAPASTLSLFSQKPAQNQQFSSEMNFVFCA